MAKTETLGLELTTEQSTLFGLWQKAMNDEGDGTAERPYSNMQIIDAYLGGIKSKPLTLTLKADSWDEQTSSQQIDADGMTEDAIIVVSPSGNPSTYANAGIYCSAQAEGTLTFACENAPESDVEVNILIINNK